MADIILFHHAQGLTEGVRDFGDELRASGHRVTVPDLYDGKTFDTLEEGIGYAQQAGFATILERGRAAAQSLPSELVYGGFSLGGMPAQMLAQTRPGAKGALLFHACIPTSEFGGPWPKGVPVQIHMMEDDPWGEEDLVAARDLADSTEDAQLFLYPGDRHLFTDSSLPAYDEGAASRLKQNVIEFLGMIE